MHAFNCGNAVEDWLGVENLKIGIGCGAGDRIGRVRVPVEKSARAITAGEGIVDAAGRDRGGEGKESAGEALGPHTSNPGTTPARSQANIRPVRPNPVRTSSAMSKTSWAAVRRRMPERNSSG